MANSDDKKWFVYVVDHHEGPISESELATRLEAGAIQSQSYVWCDGMADWRILQELPELKHLLNQNTAASTGDRDFTVVDPIAVAHAATAGLSVSEPFVASPQEPSPLSSAPATHAVIASDAAPAAPAIEMKPEESPKPPKKKRSRLFPYLLAALFTASGAFVLTSPWTEPFVQPLHSAITGFWSARLVPLLSAIPYLNQWVSPIPPLPQLSATDYQELQNAARSVPTRFAVVADTRDTSTSVAYFSGNVRDGAQLDVYWVGIPDTLLNSLSFSLKLEVSFSQKIAQTPPLRDPDGRALARGEYWVLLVAPPGSSDAEAIVSRTEMEKLPRELRAVLPLDARIVAKKSVFLGGLKDEVYTARLKEFHDRISEKAKNELAELKQFHATLKLQLEGTSAKYTSLKKGAVTSVHRKVWNGYVKQWGGLMNQLVSTVQKWSTEQAERENYYGGLYRLTLDATQAIQALHELENAYFVGVRTGAALDQEHDEAFRGAQSLLDQIARRIQAIDTAGFNPGGLPPVDPA